MLTVREVLADVNLALLAGEGHLDMPVRWVHISELVDPTPWLSGGELLLTTGLALNSPKRQRDYIATLADHGLAGLGLGTGFTHEKVPKALLEAARDRDFPLFEVPYELPFIALTEHAFTRLVNEQYALLQRSIAAQERLQRIVLSERGLDAIVASARAAATGAASCPPTPSSPRAAWRCRWPAATPRARAPAASRRPGSWPPRTPTAWPRSIA
jgi:purine catabolism regulator